MIVNIQTAAFRVMTQVGGTASEEHTASNYATKNELSTFFLKYNM
jgi:hypothetical protein